MQGTTTETESSAITTGDQSARVAETLRAARALIEKPENWCQKYLSMTADGEGQVGIPAHDAVSFCMNGALLFVCGLSQNGQFQGALRVLEDVTCQPNIVFNDTHTHAEVLAAFDRAIKLADADQGTSLAAHGNHDVQAPAVEAQGA